MTEIRHTMTDIDEDDGAETTAMIGLGEDIDICVAGYGTVNGDDMPVVRVLMEGGRLKVLVWSTQKEEDPIVIDMEMSRIPERKPA